MPSISCATASSTSRCGASASETPARISTSRPWKRFATSVATAAAEIGSSSFTSRDHSSKTPAINLRQPAVASRHRPASSSSASPAAHSSHRIRT